MGHCLLDFESIINAANGPACRLKKDEYEYDYMIRTSLSIN